MKSIGDVHQHGTIRLIPIELIVSSPFQVRTEYGDIEGLARDIEARGLLYPILVRPVDGGKFEIVHGHRRFMAVKSLGRKYIECFVRELSDSEAIIINGCENLKRKELNHIEEGQLYKLYKEYMEKELGRPVSCEEVAQAFGVEKTVVACKIALLNLPDNIKKKIISGEISYHKARALLPLVGNVLSTDNTSRSNRYFFELQRLADEIEKGARGGLRTVDGIEKAVDLIQQGVPIDEAIDKAKLEETLKIAKQQLEKGEDPKVVIKSILDSQQDPKAVLDAAVELNIENLKKLLKSGALRCPYCGKDDLVWECTHKRVNDDGEEKTHTLNNFVK